MSVLECSLEVEVRLLIFLVGVIISIAFFCIIALFIGWGQVATATAAAACNYRHLIERG